MVVEPPKSVEGERRLLPAFDMRCTCLATPQDEMLATSLATSASATSFDLDSALNAGCATTSA